MSALEPVIGLEVHAQLATRTKLFCGCETRYGAPPNTQVCPICLGYPGALPVPNEQAIELAVRAGLALGCTIGRASRFDRKSYFYPDLPKGYQISQLDLPINEGGELRVGERVIGLERAHLEEDAAKSQHVGSQTRVDFNRGGVPLLEIVSKPELRSPAEAEAYLRELRLVLMTIGVNDGNLEEGSFRCDANISLRPVGSETFGTRVEIKNVNSFRFVRLALEAEIARQKVVLGSGGTVERETRSWDESSQKTVAMRGKEAAADYRYFPDPDLPAIALTDAQVEAWRDAMPELPAARHRRWLDAGLTDYDAGVLGQHPATAAYFDAVCAASAMSAKKVANFIQSEVLGHIATDGLDATLPVPADALAELLDLLDADTIHGQAAKKVFGLMVEEGLGAKALVQREGLAQETDEGAIEASVRAVLEAHPDQVAQYREGKTKMIGFFVGQVMKASKGKANPKAVKAIAERLLEPN
ncbi:MAG: Asp-tRNA(Asn)/Glu-tRNA(Gln) amidotransferase subunit GatB [Deltaproteobacteria bacterium]|nr:Asp-tRNA(Asn)/Glu-tRNA(Gln) amidotransferase subunit GatB [Deltaproteobacteria bacterium]